MIPVAFAMESTGKPSKENMEADILPDVSDDRSESSHNRRMERLQAEAIITGLMFSHLQQQLPSPKLPKSMKCPECPSPPLKGDEKPCSNLPSPKKAKRVSFAPSAKGDSAFLNRWQLNDLRCSKQDAIKASAMDKFIWAQWRLNERLPKDRRAPETVTTVLNEYVCRSSPVTNKNFLNAQIKRFSKKAKSQAASEDPKVIALTQCYTELAQRYERILQLQIEKDTANAASNLGNFFWAQWQIGKALHNQPGQVKILCKSKPLPLFAAARNEYYAPKNPDGPDRPLNPSCLVQHLEDIRTRLKNLKPDSENPKKSETLKQCYTKLAAMFQKRLKTKGKKSTANTR